MKVVALYLNYQNKIVIGISMDFLFILHLIEKFNENL